MLRKLGFLAVLFVLGAAMPATALFTGFEDGTEGATISGVSGLTFTTSGGNDWVYGSIDATAPPAPYNINSIDLAINHGIYQMYGRIFAWLGVSQDWGRIDFTDQNGTWFQVGVTSASDFWLEAYDSGGVLLDTAHTGTNYGGSDMAFLRVDAGAGNNIAYVIVHDTGNYWLIDEFEGDMAGTDSGGGGQHGDHVVPEPTTLVLLGMGAIGSVLRKRFFA